MKRDSIRGEAWNGQGLRVAWPFREDKGIRQEAEASGRAPIAKQGVRQETGFLTMSDPAPTPALPTPWDRAHETRTEVRYAETDQMGFAHHSVAVTWFELGRVGWLRAIGLPYGQLEREGILLPVTRLSLRYLAPARFEDQLAIQTRLLELQRVRLVVENRVLRIASGSASISPVLLVEGQVELACIDPAGKPCRIPEPLRARMGAWLGRPPANGA